MGYDVIGSYLARIGKRETTECWFCGALEDDVGHTLSGYPRWFDDRQRLVQVIGGSDYRGTGGGSPLRSQGVVCDLALAETVIRRKENREREREILGIHRLQSNKRRQRKCECDV